MDHGWRCRYIFQKGTTLQDNPPPTPIGLPKRSLRPPPLGHVWAWIIVSVSIVILTSITMWVVVSGQTSVHNLSDREVVHRIVEQWRKQWPQAPGPPDVYASQAVDAVHSGDMKNASRRLAMALALDSNRAEDWARMICLSAALPDLPHTIRRSEIEQIIPLLGSLDVPPAALSVARQWGDSGGALHDPEAHVARCFHVNLMKAVGESMPQTLDTIPATP